MLTPSATQPVDSQINALSFRYPAMSCRIQDPLKQWERKQKENKGFFLLAVVTGSPALAEGTTTT